MASKQAAHAASFALFCSSLRQQPEFALTASILLKSEDCRWRETRLETHDIAVPMKISPQGYVSFRFIMLSPISMDDEHTAGRIERLHYLDGGANAGIIFLLGDSMTQEPLASFIKLQIKYAVMEWTKARGGLLILLTLCRVMGMYDMPILPLSSLEALPNTIRDFYAALGGAAASRPPPVSAVRELLPYCALRGPLKQHAVNLLTDITCSLADLVEKVSTDEGRDRIRNFLDESDAARAIEYWTEEFTQ